MIDISHNNHSPSRIYSSPQHSSAPSIYLSSKKHFFLPSFFYYFVFVPFFNMTGKGNRLSHSDHGPAKSGKSHKFVNQDSAFDYPYSPSNYFRQPIMFNGQDTSFVYEGDNQVIQQNLKMLSKKSDQTRLRVSKLSHR